MQNGYYLQQELPRNMVDELQFDRQIGYMLRFRTDDGGVLDCDARTGVVRLFGQPQLPTDRLG